MLYDMLARLGWLVVRIHFSHDLRLFGQWQMAAGYSARDNTQHTHVNSNAPT